MTDFDTAATLSEITEATEHLLADAAILTEDDLRAPSLCDGWTRSHVLNHIARNADGLVNGIITITTGVDTPMYASQEARDADIAAGVGRTGAEIVADLKESAERFRAAFESVAPEQWGLPIRRVPGGPELTSATLGARRLNEVLVHHVDLDTDFTPAHWPSAFTEYQFADSVQRFSANEAFPPLRLHVEEDDSWHGVRAAADDETVIAVHGPQRALLAWLMGRASGDGLVTELPEGGRGPLPEIPSWG